MAPNLRVLMVIGYQEDGMAEDFKKTGVLYRFHIG